MTGAEKISEATKTLSDIKKNIQEKYDRVIGRIDKYTKEIDETIADKTKSDQAKDKKIAKLKQKIKDLTNDINAWLEQKLKDAQVWLDNIKKEIEDFIKELLMSMVLAIAGV